LKKRKLTRIVLILTLIAGIITFTRVSFSFLFPMYLSHKLGLNVNDASSIGVIGGADGPTAIYIVNQSSTHWITAIMGVITIIGIVYLILERKAVK